MCSYATLTMYKKYLGFHSLKGTKPFYVCVIFFPVFFSSVGFDEFTNQLVKLQ